MPKYRVVRELYMCYDRYLRQMNAPLIILFFLILPITTLQDHNFDWLKGTWKLEEKNVFEVWKTDAGNQNLSGRSFSLEGGDTTVTEIISIQFYDGSFHYIPDISGDQPPIDFKITSYDSNSFKAENQGHDFPKIIRYRYFKSGNDERIEATLEGNGEIISYAFKKLK